MGGASQSYEYDGLKKRVALLPFLNESPYGGEDLGIVVTEELRRELSKTQEFIVDYQASQMFGASKEIYAGGGMKLIQMSREAKKAGVHLVIFGRIIEARIREKSDEIGLLRKTRASTENKIELRIYDVSSKREILTEIIQGYADDENLRFFLDSKDDQVRYRRNFTRYGVRVAARSMIPKIIQVGSKLDWLGRVAKIVGTKIYINAGRASGINLGDVLKVMAEGNNIFDPETGALMGVATGEVKGTLEVIDYFGPDGAVAILHSGGSVIEGDYVMLY
jgi:hypothetical protein